MFHAHTSPYTCKFSGDLGHMEWVFFQQAFVVGVVLPVVVPDDGRDVLMKVSCQFLATGLAGSRLSSNEYCGRVELCFRASEHEWHDVVYPRETSICFIKDHIPDPMILGVRSTVL